MRFILTIECDNAAFEENGGGELRRILKRVAESFDDGEKLGPDTVRLADINGNTVGEWRLEE